MTGKNVVLALRPSLARARVPYTASAASPSEQRAAAPALHLTPLYLSAQSALDVDPPTRPSRTAIAS